MADPDGSLVERLSVARPPPQLDACGSGEGSACPGRRTELSAYVGRPRNRAEVRPTLPSRCQPVPYTRANLSPPPRRAWSAVANRSKSLEAAVAVEPTRLGRPGLRVRRHRGRRHDACARA